MEKPEQNDAEIGGVSVVLEVDSEYGEELVEELISNHQGAKPLKVFPLLLCQGSLRINIFIIFTISAILITLLFFIMVDISKLAIPC